MTTAPYASVDRTMAEFFAVGGAPGLAYGVVADGRLVHAGAHGVARIRGEVPDASTVFRIASMTKSFVGATVLSLRDEGRLSLEAPVATYVPELEGVRGPTRDSPPPTVRDLLTMSAGLVTDDPWADRNEAMTPAELDALLRRGLTFDSAPGTRFEYSNLGWTLLGRVVTNVAGAQFQDVVTERVLRPLGLTSTGFTLDDVPAERLADGHFRLDDTWHVEPTSSTGEFAALGGLFSTVEDLAVWVATLCRAFPPRDDDDPCVPASRASLREMQQAHRFVGVVRGAPGDDRLPGEANAYGYGLMITEHPRFGTFVNHGGGYPGYGSHMVWHPATGLGIVGLANGRYAGPYRATRVALFALLAELEAAARVVRPTAAATSARSRVDALVEVWDDAVASELFAPNVDGDLPRERRVADVRAAVDLVGGLVGPAYDVTAHAPSRLVWWRPGAHGRLRVEMWLTPESPQRVQVLDVRGVPDPDPALVAVAERIAAALLVADPSWPGDVEVAPAVDVEAVLVEARRAWAAGAVGALEPLPVAATSAYDATFEARGAEARSALTVALDGGVVTSCRLVVSGDEWPTESRTELTERIEETL
ncbi:MAG: serine hydrolase domain-containing protein [Candidatus Nanopelagicales bacterium]